MTGRWIRVAASIVGCCIIAVVVLLASDANVAVNRMNPVPAAEAAAANAGWEVQQLDLESVKASGGPLGSSAVVTYSTGDANGTKHLDVHLHRALLSRNWKIVKVEPR